MEQVLKRQNPHPRDENILFFEEGHRYEITSDPNSKYTSVTTWIHTHFKKFDADKVIKNMMKGRNWNSENKYWGQTAEQIKQLWNENGKRESQSGTDLHFNIECFMNNAQIMPNYTHTNLLRNYEANPKTHFQIEWQFFLNFIIDTPEFKPFRTEWTVYDEDLKLAGSIDMIYQNPDGSLDIYDWKRSKGITKVNNWNEFSLTPCIAELPDTNFWHYSLQLNIYKRILEKNYGYTVKDLFLVRLHPNAEDQNYELIEVPDLSEQVTRLFEEKYLNNNL